MISDDLSSAVSTSAFTDCDDEDDEEEQESREMKYTPVKVEIEIDDDDMLSPETDLSNDDHFLISFHNNTAGDDEIDGGTADKQDLAECSEVKKKRISAAAPKRERKRASSKPQAVSKRMKRAQMTPVEREKQREKWKIEARVKRMKAKQQDELNELVVDVKEVDDLSPSNQSAGKAKGRVMKIEEPESADDQDYQVEDDDDDDEDYGSKKKKRKSTGRSRKRPTASRRISDRKVEGENKKSPRQTVGSGKKRVSEMTEEEREVMKTKWREEARIKRARQRETDTDEYLRLQREKRREQRQSGSRIKEENAINTEDEGEEGGKKVKRGDSSNSRSRAAPRRSEGCSKKKVSEMTEEEREAMKAKWREEARIKRARQRETMSLNDREELLRIQREKRREQRALAKLTKTEDENEQASNTERERKRALRALMTPEQRKEESQKATLRRIERLARMTDDEKKMRRMNNYLRNSARMGSLSQEEIEEQKRRRQAQDKQRLAQMTAADFERRRVMTKQYRDNMSPERKQRFLAKMREAHKRRMERLRKDPDKWDQLKAKWKEDRLAKKRKMEEMAANLDRRRDKEIAEERAQRRREQKLITQRKARLKKRLELQKLLESGMSMEEAQEQIEPPEHRERRLMHKRINKAKGILRKRLEASGVSKEEIEVRLKELEHTYQPTYACRPYKPRPECWKTTASDLGLLTREDIEKKPQMVTSKQPILTYPKPTSRSVGGSTCSDVSVAGTPEPIHYSSQNQENQVHRIHHQQSAPPQQSRLGGQRHNTTTSIHHSLQTQQMYPHHQPQTQPQQQTFPNPFQTILNSMGYQDTSPGTVAPAGSSSLFNQVMYQPVDQPTQDSSSHHGDYASSYDNHSQSPSSPLGNDDDHDYSGGSFDDFSSFQQPSTSTEPVLKRGRPRKDEPPRPRKPKGCKGGPRGSSSKRSNKTDVIRDKICDECGDGFSHAWRLRDHKNQFHNPNYRNETCQICQEKFPLARHWYKHYTETHAEPAPDMKEKSHMCDVCGSSFHKKFNLEKHKHLMHGDGSKKENFKRCPVCPGEKLFKETGTLYLHLRREHPGYNYGGHACYRCDNTFADENLLGLHVKAEHEDSYFPCQFCNVCRFTKMGLNFHYFRCSKITKETRNEMIRAEKGVFSLDRAPLPCEFCNRNVSIFSLTRHYWDMHNVKEANFTCPDCGKEFRRRPFWAVHMEEKHLKTLDEMKELVRCLNVATREGLDIKNQRGVFGGVPGNTPGKAAAQKRIELGGRVKRGGWVKKPTAKSKGGRNLKKQIVVTAEEEEEELDSSIEDEETGDEEMEIKTRRQIKVEAEEQEEDEEEEEEIARKTPVRQKRKPCPKSKTRRKRKDDSDKEDESKGGEDDEEAYTPHNRIVSNLAPEERRYNTRTRNNTSRKFREENSSSEEEQKKDEEGSQDSDY